jgi:type IV pilus assembly protein PilF
MKWISLAFVLFLAGCVTAKKHTEQAALHLQLAVNLVQQENYPVALQELLTAQDLDPSNADVQAYLGFVYFIRERIDLAEKHFKKAVILNPKFSDAKNNLARVYIETGRLKEAELLLKEILVDYTYSDFPRAYFNYGLLEFHRKNYRTSLNYFGKAILKDRENCLAHVYIGRNYLELKQTQVAVDELTKAINFCQPLQVDDAHYYNAIALFRNNQKDLATVRFQELLKLFPAGKNRENAQKMLDVISKGNL